MHPSPMSEQSPFAFWDLLCSMRLSILRSQMCSFSKKILIGSSKTDQFRDGARVVVAHTHSSCYPLAMLER